MLLANNEDGIRIRAFPKGIAFCPSCESQVIAKCGEYKIWHWAHATVKDCDPWHENETPWHLGWKSYFPTDWQEVVIKKFGEIHRADLLLPNGIVVEFQHSPISSEEIQERSDFYIWSGNGIFWIFDIRKAYLEENFKVYRKYSEEQTFTWKYAKSSIIDIPYYKLFDLAPGKIFYPTKINRWKYIGGTGFLHNFSEKDTAEMVNTFANHVLEGEL